MNERDKIASGSSEESKATDPSAAAPESAKSSDVKQRAASHGSVGQSNPPAIPDYELLRRIGGGSYGDVWLARSATGAMRALKIVWRHTFEDERPFQREFEGIQRFERLSREHPSQLALFHVGRGEGYFYYVMELADDAFGEKEKRGEGERESETSAPVAAGEAVVSSAPFPPFSPASYTPRTLRADLAQGRLPATRVLEIGLALTEALSHLHANGLVHRDVKPSNVIFVNGRPKLADIGLVTDAGDTRSIVGTEGYLAPEGPGTPQADLFALGKVLYEALTGLDRRQLPQLPPDLRSWPDARLVFELNEVILKACASTSHQRYKSSGEMLDDLALLRKGKSVRQKRTSEQRWASGKKAGTVLAGLAALTASIVILSRGITPTDLYPDGPPSTNTVANMFCERGMQIIRGDFHAQFADAFTNFHRAIELDTNFAKPFVGLLELRSREVVPSLGPMTSDEFFMIAQKLKQLGPDLAATHQAQSLMNWFDWDYPQAKSSALQAIKANPRYEMGHTWYGFLLTHWGWPAEGRAELDIAQRVGPAKATVYRMYGHTYYAERNYTNAIKWYRKALDLATNHTAAYKFIGQAYQAVGDYTNALDNLEQHDILEGANEAETKRRYDGLRSALNAEGVRGYWQEEWKQTEKNLQEDLYWKAVIQIHLGSTNAALDLLKRSSETHERGELDGSLNYLLFDEYWDGLHDDTRFRQLLDKIGFNKVMPAQKK